MDDEKKLDDIIDQMDREIQELTGGKPQEFDVKQMFTESQAIQKSLYGGGEENPIEREYLDGLRKREEEIQKRREQLLSEAEEVEELNDLEVDGIFIKK
jgi:hypothetical protein